MPGVLFFPVTPFDSRDRVDLEVFAEHVGTGLDHSPGAVFPACGTGEVHALSDAEHRAVVEAAVELVNGRVPVVAGAGGPLGQALAMARGAAEAGADALLVLPPYLVTGSQDGLVAYVEAIAHASELPVIVYNRGLATFAPKSIERLLTNPKVVGVKDGVGDIAAVQRFTLAARRAGREGALFFNGLLTAELSQRAYAAIGVPMYSSAAFAMAPTIATRFFDAYTANDHAVVDELLESFYEPLVRLRDKVPGYGVSLIKAGLRLGGLNVGSVRPPLTDPHRTHLAELESLLAANGVI